MGRDRGSIIPIEPEPPTIILSPARRRLDTRLDIHGAVQAIRLALRHNARASVGLNRAWMPGTAQIPKAAQPRGLPFLGADDLLRAFPGPDSGGWTDACKDIP